MNLDAILKAAPDVLEALTRELFINSDAAILADKKSQLTACLQLGLRSASIMHGMSKVLDLHTLDAYDTLNRAAIESRDLLMHFRFNDADTKRRISYWFAGVKDSSWKADHGRLDQFLTRQGALRGWFDLERPISPPTPEGLHQTTEEEVLSFRPCVLFCRHEIAFCGGWHRFQNTYLTSTRGAPGLDAETGD